MSQTYAKMSFELYVIWWAKSDMENYGEYAHFGPLKIKRIEKKRYVKGEARIRTYDP